MPTVTRGSANIWVGGDIGEEDIFSFFETGREDKKDFVHGRLALVILG